VTRETTVTFTGFILLALKTTWEQGPEFKPQYIKKSQPNNDKNIAIDWVISLLNHTHLGNWSGSQDSWILI
jgi:hypothetical protein